MISSNAVSGQLSVGRNAACARHQAQPITRCALSQGMTQLAGLPLRILCGVPWAAKRTGQSSTITPVLIPFLRTVYSVAQFRNSGTNFGGTFAGFQLRVMLHLHKGWIQCVSIHFAL